MNPFGEDLQRAALDPDRWPDLLHRVSQESGALGAILISEAHQIPVPPISRDLVPLMARYYGEGWNTRDVRFRGIDIAVRDGAVRDQDILSADELRVSPYYQELLRPEGCMWFCSLSLRVAGGHWFLTVQRTIGQEPFTSTEVARLKTLRRPIEAAAGLSHALSFSRVAGMTDAFEQLAKPALVLDERGLLLRCNARAEKILIDLAKLNYRAIEFHDQGNQRSFEQSIAEAGFPAQCNSRPRIYTALRDGAGQTWNLETTALSDWARYSFTQASFLVCFNELRAEPSPATLWKARYGLTPAESRLAGALAAGLALRSFADSHGISYQTVRTQLKSVLFKTGARRQSELVSLLLQRSESKG